MDVLHNYPLTPYLQFIVITVFLQIFFIDHNNFCFVKSIKFYNFIKVLLFPVSLCDNE